MPNPMFQPSGLQPFNFGQFGGQQAPQDPSQTPMQPPQGGWGQAPVSASDGGGVASPMQSPSPLQSPGLPNMQRPGGMFAEGGVGRNIAGSIGDYLLQMAHAQPIFAPTQRYKMQAAIEQQQYEARQQSELQRQISLAQWNIDHPNDENTIMARQAGYTPGTPAFQRAMQGAFQAKTNPLVAYKVDDGQGGQTMEWRPQNPNMTLPPPDWDGKSPLTQPGAQGTPAPVRVTDAASYAAVKPGDIYTTPDGHTRQKPGGQTPPASGTFRY